MDSVSNRNFKALNQYLKEFNEYRSSVDARLNHLERMVQQAIGQAEENRRLLNQILAKAIGAGPTKR